MGRSAANGETPGRRFGFKLLEFGRRPSVAREPPGTTAPTFERYPLQTTIDRIRQVLVIAAAGVIACLAASQAGAQSATTYPNRPVKLVIPFPPGGPLDIIGRL